MDEMDNLYLKVLQKNRMLTDGFHYTVPSADTYPYQWLWDSCFHAIILSHYKADDAKAEIFALLSKQLPNGMIPHMIYWKNSRKAAFPKIEWGKDGTSTITQPPMLAYAVWQIFKEDKDRKFLEQIYTHLYHFYKYLLNDRDPHEKHLIGIMNPDESGEDNSPRFDLPLGLPPKQTRDQSLKRRLELVTQNIECKFDAPFCMRNFFWVKDTAFNSIMVANLKLLAKIAAELKIDEDAIYFMKQAEDIAIAMREFMMDDGLFYSTYGKDYKKIKVKTWAIFTPLFAEILSREEATKLVTKHLFNKKEFWPKYPVPTTALDEPAFDPKGFWRGPTWIATNWFIYKGLMKYGLKEEAEEIKRSSLELIDKSGFREYFNPLTGEGLGAKNFTWGGLALDMD
ncbi:hypothetical protein HYS95_03975 [Candidatus Daviesbacteria bacterium]|nr:hypothetical protein [Candidatus Daviesbacteria bacterium]